MIQDIEHKRLECNRLMRNKNKRKISKFLKTPEMIEQEAQQAKWKTSKVSLKTIRMRKICNAPFLHLGQRGIVSGSGGLPISDKQIQFQTRKRERIKDYNI